MTTNIKQLFISTLGLIILGGGAVKAQEVPEVLANKLSATLDSMWLLIDNKSLSAAMQFNDNAVWEDAAGYSILTPEVEVTTAHKYEIGSITKTLTGACVLQLVDEGILHLDDSVFTWLEPIPFVDSTITIRQLLQHKSGLYEVLSNADLQPTLLLDQDSIWQAKDVINTFIQAPYDEPGSTWSYCNTGYFMLGMIIEAATGNPFYEEIRNRFLDPLALSSIGIPSFETYTGPIAHVWLDITGDGVTDDAHFFYYNWLSLNSAVAAARGILCHT
jgi:D-alanyl-D-alanine carboxypeptidase